MAASVRSGSMVPWNVAPSASMILAVVRCARTMAVDMSSMRSRREDRAVERAADRHRPRDDLAFHGRPGVNRQVMVRHRDLPVEVSLDREVLAREQVSDDLQAAQDARRSVPLGFINAPRRPDRRARRRPARRRRFLRQCVPDPIRAPRRRCGRTRRSPRAGGAAAEPSPVRRTTMSVRRTAISKRMTWTTSAPTVVTVGATGARRSSRSCISRMMAAAASAYSADQMADDRQRHLEPQIARRSRWPALRDPRSRPLAASWSRSATAGTRLPRRVATTRVDALGEGAGGRVLRRRRP